MAEVTDLDAVMVGLPDGDFETPAPKEPSVRNPTPITDSHVTWLTPIFKAELRVGGKRLTFHQIARMSKCAPGNADTDFTSEGILEGKSVTAAQVERVYKAWTAEKVKREAPIEEPPPE